MGSYDRAHLITIIGRVWIPPCSRATDSTLRFTSALHVPTASRTLTCLGKAMRSGVFWHFDSCTDGYLEVTSQGYWGDIILESTDLLFLAADIVRPAVSHPSSEAPLMHRPGLYRYRYMYMFRYMNMRYITGTFAKCGIMGTFALFTVYRRPEYFRPPMNRCSGIYSGTSEF
jgi:hypothetical protein